VVLPQPPARAPITGGKSVQELQKLVEEALVLLSRESDDGAVVSEQVETSARAPVLGAASGSAVGRKSTRTSRIVKTVIGLAIAFVVGLVPLKMVLTTASTEAFVNAPLSILRAPADGTLVGADLTIGSRVDQNNPLAYIEPPNGAARIPITAPNAGKIWETLVPSGATVVQGQEIARIVACSAASITASVSETVYDRLAPGTPARFNFYGSDQFYSGTVANLLGHGASAENLAISPASLASDAYRVIVSIPDLGAIPNCAVGRRGEVVFDTRSR
jgi:biotin carboxyl carrier protein